ncbi:PREDICTED: uncharacterized protein LOC105512433 [Colobus angolensis palliatus]|uniref:uncharacterized protein LOC105512433 n=1 Tax=Colobus angolensis palliatus TaxID=336983 RepID=UPI0005F38B4B|nr:PREDICTED: uncharacterized protein LOC105512433 [Colobus angolensis palliatus]
MTLGQCLSDRFPAPGAVKLRPFLVPWSPALNCVSSSAQVGSLALMGIDGGPGGKLVLGPLSLGQCQSARHPAPSALKLRTFLEPLASALSCDGEPGGRLVLTHRPQANVSQVLISWCAETLALLGTLVSCTVLWITLRPSLGNIGGSLLSPCSHLVPFRSSTQEVPLALTGIVSSSAKGVLLAMTNIDGEHGGRLALGPMALGQCLSASSSPRCTEAQAFPGTLISCTELWAPVFWAGDLEALKGISWTQLYLCAPPWGSPASLYWLVSSSVQVVPPALSSIDGEPGGRLVLGPQAPGQGTSARCSAHGALTLRPFLVPWSPALSCGDHIQVPLDACVGRQSALVSSSEQMGSLALTDIVSCATQEVPLVLTGIDQPWDTWALGQGMARIPLGVTLSPRSSVVKGGPLK